MFDNTNPADLLALKTEVNTDPITMGYAAVVDNTALLLKLLNEAANNVGGDTASRPFDVVAMMDALDPANFEAPQTTASAANYVHILVEMGAFSDISNYKTKFADLFAANSSTVTALNAQNVDLSRAEVLFGQGSSISRNDWIVARDS